MEKKKTKKKKKLSRSALMLIIACSIILIPIIVFLGILGTSMIGNDTPNTGDRFKNDLNPAISSSNQKNIESDIKSLSGVENVEINLPTAELRVYINANDSSSKEEIEKIAEEAYEVVNKEIPVSTYFTASNDGKKMYDLEITVYNYIDGDEDNQIIYSLTKNSNMGSYKGQFISEPISPETAASVTGSAPSSTETGDTTTTE